MASLREKARAMNRVAKGTAQGLSDERLLDAAALFDEWAAGKSYIAGDVVILDGVLYRVEQTHPSQAHQPPGSEGMLAVYRPVQRQGEGGEVLPWVSGEAVDVGDRREHAGVVYECYAPAGANIWVPPEVPAIWRVVG